MSFWERLRALGWFLLASAWFLFADLVAFRAATGLSTSEWQEPLYRVFLLFLLVMGYWIMARLGQRRTRVARATGLDARPGWGSEFGLGAALGWAAVLVCVLPAALTGSFAVTFFTSGHQIFVLFLDLIALLAGTLAVEVAFRGYPFLRLVEALGPVVATFFMAVVYAIWRTHAAPASTAAVLVSFLLAWALGLAVLRTRALWVGWGLHFAWLAVFAVALGLPVSGTMNYSPVVITNTRGAGWITGNTQGPEASAIAVIVAFVLVFVVVTVTGDLKYKYAQPEIVPGGIPVDLDEIARRQHEAAQAHAEPQPPPLVQIQPASSDFAAPPRYTATAVSPQSTLAESPAPTPLRTDYDEPPPPPEEPPTA